MSWATRRWDRNGYLYAKFGCLSTSLKGVEASFSTLDILLAKYPALTSAHTLYYYICIMMIDLHSHVLPGVDDGPDSIEGSLDICRMAAADGISVIVATPHFKPGLFELPTSELITERLSTLNDRVRDEGLKLKILSGAEVRLSPSIWEYLDTVDFLTINKTGKYMLAEFPMGSLPEGWLQMLEKCLVLGITPVLVHPERNSLFLRDPSILAAVVGGGVLVQLTAESVVGRVGDDIQRFSHMLIREGLAHVIATDSHSIGLRAPVLSGAVEVAATLVGKERAMALVTTTPEAIIAGVPVKIGA